ncbi:hypothetical protein Baya_6436 [Bagarius yarrelli]|uniref:Uncharacterized protein n=1 Tax=Bagarius yarrelli TaxID=175774 RepID=A0A556U092_BAGYA|nr:hypothetical protein Baya_6436 [Bagarius yarrelli]
MQHASYPRREDRKGEARTKERVMVEKRRDAVDIGLRELADLRYHPAQYVTMLGAYSGRRDDAEETGEKRSKKRKSGSGSLQRTKGAG